jgi:hypothetical protein
MLSDSGMIRNDLGAAIKNVKSASESPGTRKEHPLETLISL